MRVGRPISFPPTSSRHVEGFYWYAQYHPAGGRREAEQSQRERVVEGLHTPRAMLFLIVFLLLTASLTP